MLKVLQSARYRTLFVALALSACSQPTASSALSLYLSGSLNDPDVTALVDWVVDGSNLQPESALFTLSGGMLYVTMRQTALNGTGLTFNVPARVGSYALQTGSGVGGEGTPTYMCLTRNNINCDNGRGTVTVSRATVQAGGGNGIFDIAVSFNVTTDGGRQVRASVSSCVDRHSSVSCTGGTGGSGGGGTGGTVGGGGSSAACENSFVIDRLKGTYSTATLSSAKSVAASPVRTTSSTGEPVIVLNSDEKIEGQTRYQVQVIIPTGRFRVDSMSFVDDANIPGLENGAVGVLVYSVGTSFGTNVTDSFRTNRDWGRNRVVGTLKITSMTPKIQGTFSFQGSGDGYPSLTDYFASVSNGRFCVTP